MGDQQADSAPVATECDNCARPDAELAAVRRVYVIPEAWDREGSITVLDEVERWCFSCRSHYPFEPVDG